MAARKPLVSYNTATWWVLCRAFSLEGRYRQTRGFIQQGVFHAFFLYDPKYYTDIRHGALQRSRIRYPIMFGGTRLGSGPRLQETRPRLVPKVGTQNKVSSS